MHVKYEIAISHETNKQITSIFRNYFILWHRYMGKTFRRYKKDLTTVLKRH